MSDPGVRTKIFEQIPKIMLEMDAIGKNQKNLAQNFKFRGIDEVYNELHSLLGKHGVMTVPKVLKSTREERQTKSGGLMTYTLAEIEYTFFAQDGSFFQAVVLGEGSDTGDKSSNKAMAVAHKYALLQVFAIPTEDKKDPDFDSHEVDSAKPQPKPEVKAPAQPRVVTGEKKSNPIPIAGHFVSLDEEFPA